MPGPSGVGFVGTIIPGCAFALRLLAMVGREGPAKVLCPLLGVVFRILARLFSECDVPVSAAEASSRPRTCPDPRSFVGQRVASRSIRRAPSRQ